MYDENVILNAPYDISNTYLLTLTNSIVSFGFQNVIGCTQHDYISKVIT